MRDSVIERIRRVAARTAGRYLVAVVGALAIVATRALPAQPPALPQPVGYVNDFANVIPADAEQRLTQLAERLQAATRGDMVIVTLPDLGGRPVEEVSLRLGREWKVGADAKIGDAARNAGVVILIVPKETASDGRGRCRIETGQGAEGFITDATAGTLCREQTERFRAQDYAGAIEGLAFAVADRYAAAFNVTLDGQPREVRRPRGGGGDGGGFPVVLVIIIVLFILSSLGGRRRRGCVGCIPIPVPGGPVIFTGGSHGWGGGGFGGGSFGGGGFGGFGGGGGFSGGGGGSDW